MKNFNMCPMCGSKNIQFPNNRKWFCPDCKFDLYFNVAAAVGVIFYDDTSNVLFEVRVKNPKAGMMALPGGFVDADETAENAAIRECKEEMNVDVTDINFLCTFPNTYEYKNIEYKTCDLFFTAKIPSEYKNMEDFIKSLQCQESEVGGFKFFKVESYEDVDSIPLAFDSAKKVLCKFVEKQRFEKK